MLFLVMLNSFPHPIECICIGLREEFIKDVLRKASPLSEYPSPF
jgi:hypothetical protein